MCLVLERQRRMRNNLFVVNHGVYLKEVAGSLENNI